MAIEIDWKIKGKIVFLSEGVISKELEKIFGLFQIKTVATNQPVHNIYVIVDEKTCDPKTIDDLTSGDKIFYFTWESPHQRDDLSYWYFLTNISAIPTYKIFLEQFSIADLAKILETIFTLNEEKLVQMAENLSPKLNDIIKKISAEEMATIGQFNQFLHSPEKFIEGQLHRKDPKEDKESLNNILVEIRKYEMWFSFLQIPSNLPMQILIVENRPETIFWGQLADFFPNIECNWVVQNLEKFKAALQTKEESFVCNTGWEGKGTQKLVRFKDIDLILQDIYLGSEVLSGRDFTELYFDVAPQALLFYLTGMDVETLAAMGYEKNVDRIISKHRIEGLMKAFYDEFHRTFGQMIWQFFIKKDEKQKKYVTNLMANLHFWKCNPNLLWFGDKCYHMINHSFAHCQNVWNISNQLLGPIWQSASCAAFHENLYPLAMAVWLHDIGHKGNQRYGEPHLIRDTHGLISAEFFCSSPEIFNLIEEDGKENREYQNMIFPFGPQKKSLPQILKEKFRKPPSGNGLDNLEKLTNLEKTALLSIYHQGSSPVDAANYRDSINKEKLIPLEFFNNQNRLEDEITLELILQDFSLTERGKFLDLAFLFRFLDGVDIQRNRVGGEVEKKLKKRTIKQDKDNQKEIIRKKVESMARKLNDLHEIHRHSFLKTFYLDVAEKIDNGEFISHLQLSTLAKDIADDFEDYFARVNYASFISVQDGHFDLHSSIKEVRIEHLANPLLGINPIRVSYFTDRSLGDLQNKSVKELRDKNSKKIDEYLLGSEKEGYQDGYLVKEWKKGEKFLKKYFTLVEVCLITTEPKGPQYTSVQFEGTRWTKIS